MERESSEGEEESCVEGELVNSGEEHVSRDPSPLQEGQVKQECYMNIGIRNQGWCWEHADVFKGSFSRWVAVGRDLGSVMGFQPSLGHLASPLRRATDMAHIIDFSDKGMLLLAHSIFFFSLAICHFVYLVLPRSQLHCNNETVFATSCNFEWRICSSFSYLQ